MNDYIARQPIFDNEIQLFGYEFLFRDVNSLNSAPLCGPLETLKLISSSLVNFDLSQISQNKNLFINFTLENLKKKHYLYFDKDKLVIEVLEDINPTDELLVLFRDIKVAGYTLALDDFEFSDAWQDFLPFVSIIKIDVLNKSIFNVGQAVEFFKNYSHILLLAEKVESHEEYTQYLNMGFNYFQGYFFAKPERLTKKFISPFPISLGELLYQTSGTDINLKVIIEIFEHDVPLTLKLFRYANSAAFFRKNEISSIKNAIIALGKVELERFVALLFISSANNNKPKELITLSLIRAKFLESVCNEFQYLELNPETAYLTGIFSLVDAITDEEMSVIIEQLPLSTEIKEAIMNNKGSLAYVLNIIKAIESDNWQALLKQDSLISIKDKKINEIYVKSLTWAHRQLDILKIDKV